MSLERGDDVVAAAHKLGLPVIVKPACEGSSVGVSRCFKDADLAAAVELAARYEGPMLVEQLIQGDEYTVGVLGLEALPSIRIVPAGEYYDYHAKYVAEDTQYICPGRDAAPRSRSSAASRSPRSSRSTAAAGAAWISCATAPAGRGCSR